MKIICSHNKICTIETNENIINQNNIVMMPNSYLIRF
jgi:hypothetical protein